LASPRFLFLLHSHMPYVRRNGDWPCGEEWILEAWAESYLPIWELIEEISSGSWPGKLAITMTPVLAEQLEDEYLQERLAAYLANKVSQAREQEQSLRAGGETERASVAAWYERRYQGLLESYEERFRGRMISLLIEAMRCDRVEVLTSAATHAHLPSLGADACRRAQVRIGIKSYEERFQREPGGFWLPECSYTPDLDGLLSGFSPPLHYVVLDHTAPQAAPEQAESWQPRRLGTTPLVALMRDAIAHEMVWTMRGMPSHGGYRDYSKRDQQGHGIQYWRITSIDTPIGEKELYDPEAAKAQAEEDASDFAEVLKKRAEGTGAEDNDPVILACYDMELLGHWWLEGPRWLREVLRLFGDDCALPREIAAPASQAPPITPSLTAWNVPDGFDTWVNPKTSDLWQSVYGAEERFLQAIALVERGADGVRALNQAGRELLILESSDWSYMITRDQAASYAKERFATHLQRFKAALKMARGDGMDLELLARYEETDNLFPGLNPSLWR
jgi:1,4-alpha-glucan branching enzyme